MEVLGCLAGGRPLQRQQVAPQGGQQVGNPLQAQEHAEDGAVALEALLQAAERHLQSSRRGGIKFYTQTLHLAQAPLLCLFIKVQSCPHRSLGDSTVPGTPQLHPQRGPDISALKTVGMSEQTGCCAQAPLQGASCVTSLGSAHLCHNC